MILSDIAIKGMLVLAAAGLVTVCLRRASAASRHLVWSAAVVTVLVLPVVLTLAPRRTVAIAEDSPLAAFAGVLTREPAARSAPTGPAEGETFVDLRTARPGQPLDAGQAAAEPAGSEAFADPASVPPRVPSPASPSPDPTTSTTPLDLGTPALAGWLAGALLVLAALAGERLHLAAIRRRASECLEGPVRETFERLLRESPMPGAPELRLGAADAMPMTWGSLRPVVLLPSSSTGWSRRRIETILRHELAHVRRRDDLVQLIATLVAALHWFDPLAWLALRRLRVEREHACDDAVLRHGAPASAYAEELLWLATELRSARATALAAQSMARPSQLSNRLLAVLAESRSRRSIGRRQVAVAATAAALLLAPLSGLAFAIVPAGPFNGLTGTIESNAARGNEAALPQAASECWRPGVERNAMNMHDSDTGVSNFLWESDRCRAEVRIEGEVYFNDDVTEIVGMEPRGQFLVQVEENGTERRLEIRADANGELEYRYLVDGRLQDDPSEGIEWLDGILQRVLRATGIAAEQRTAAIYRRAGAGGVFDEVALIYSNSVKGQYLAALSGLSGLSNDELTRLLETAERIDSNSTKSRVLAAVGRQHRDAIVVGPLEDAFWASAETIDSNSTFSRLLSNLIEGEPADSPLVTRALREAGDNIDSNSTLANFLLRLERSYPGIAAAGPQGRLFWETLDRIRSNSTVRGFLHELAAGEPVDSELLPIIFETARTRITSNSTMRAFLITMNSAYPEIAESGPLTDEFWAGVATVTSQSTLSELLLDISRGRPDDSAVVDRVLEAGVTGLSSSSTKGRFLIDFATQHPGPATRRLHDEVIAAANGIGSRSTRERTLRRLDDLGIGRD